MTDLIIKRYPVDVRGDLCEPFSLRALHENIWAVWIEDWGHLSTWSSPNRCLILILTLAAFGPPAVTQGRNSIKTRLHKFRANYLPMPNRTIRNPCHRRIPPRKKKNKSITETQVMPQNKPFLPPSLPSSPQPQEHFQHQQAQQQSSHHHLLLRREPIYLIRTTTLNQVAIAYRGQLVRSFSN